MVAVSGHPINPYGHSKAIVEQVLQDLGAAGGITYISLRYFNVAGADRDGRNGEGKEGGTYIRDYIHVEDLAAAHVLALEHLVAGGRATRRSWWRTQGKSVNLSAGCRITTTWRASFTPPGSGRRSGKGFVSLRVGVVINNVQHFSLLA
nr:NAD-dependent epimerase/dehydratase family protein [Moorella sulfitireducens]